MKERNTNMAKFDNLSIEDLREFIGLLTGDTYFPEQLLDFDAITLADAIRYLQENNSTKNSYTPVNANNIYKVSAAIEIDNLHHRLEDIKNYELDDMDISDADRKNIEEFMSHIDTLVNTESSHCMFDVNANGLQDSQISLIDDEITDTYRDAIVVLDEQTNCFSDFQDNVCGMVGDFWKSNAVSYTDTAPILVNEDIETTLNEIEQANKEKNEEIER
jgi:hypothetical protein